MVVFVLMGCRKWASASQTARSRASGAWLGTRLAASVCGRTRRAAYIQGVVTPIPYTHARPSRRFPPADCMLNTLLSASSATPSLPPPCSAVVDARPLLAVRQVCDGRRKGEDGRSGSGREALGVGLPPGFPSPSGAAGEALFTDVVRYTRPSRAWVRSWRWEPVACRCCVSRLSRGLAIQTNGVVGVVGVESSDYVGQPLRQWVLPPRGSFNGVPGGIWFGFTQTGTLGKGPKGGGDSRDRPKVSAKPGCEQWLAGCTESRNKQSVGKPGGRRVFAVADRVSE